MVEPQARQRFSTAPWNYHGIWLVSCHVVSLGGVLPERSARLPEFEVLGLVTGILEARSENGPDASPVCPTTSLLAYSTGSTPYPYHRRPEVTSLAVHSRSSSIVHGNLSGVWCYIHFFTHRLTLLC